MTTDDASIHSPSSQGSLLTRHPLLFYFLIAFAFSWLMFLPSELTYFGLLNLSPSVVGLLSIVGLLGPVFSGFIMTSVTEGRAYITGYAGSCAGAWGLYGTCSPSLASRWSWCWVRS